MNVRSAIAAGAWVLSWTISLPVAAQVSWVSPPPVYPGYVGMFGYRTYGHPSQPVAASGMFGDHVIGGRSAGFITSGRFGDHFFGPAVSPLNPEIHYRGVATPFASPNYAPEEVNAQPLPPTAENTLGNANNVYPGVEPAAMPENVMPPYPIYPENPGSPYSPISPIPSVPVGPEGAYPAGTAPAAAPGGAESLPAASPAATNMMRVPYPRGTAIVPGNLPKRAASNARAAEFSDRLTQIALSKGMLAGRGIQVSLYGDTAVLQGTVRTASDRASLANVLSLEPRVQRIDNRLLVEEKDTARSAARENR